jgi:hypothetical protein
MTTHTPSPRLTLCLCALLCTLIVTSACATLPDPLGPTPALPPPCTDSATPPSPHRLLAEHLLALAAILDAASLTTPSLTHPLTHGWLASLPAASQALPARAAAAEAAWSPSDLDAHLRCDAPPLALAQYRISAALSRVATSHPDAAHLAAQSLLSWLSPAP